MAFIVCFKQPGLKRAACGAEVMFRVRGEVLPLRAGHVDASQVSLGRRLALGTGLGRGCQQYLGQGVGGIEFDEALGQVTWDRQVVVQATLEAELVATLALRGRVVGWMSRGKVNEKVGLMRTGNQEMTNHTHKQISNNSG